MAIPILNKPCKFWMATIPARDWQPPQDLPEGVMYLKGQKEIGEGGFEHWQVVIRTTTNQRIAGCKRLLGSQSAHVEPTRSAAALAYVWKESTRVAGTQFELGVLRPKGNPTDWEEVVAKAKEGKFEEIDPAVQVRYIGNLMKIHAHHARPERRGILMTKVFIGPTGTGKTHRAVEEAEALGPVYFKSSTNKWWDGYNGEENVVIDEFDGQIGVVHLLRWLDKYPCSVEIKGGSTPLRAIRFWITSNVEVDQWYPTLGLRQVDALKRRVSVEYMDVAYQA